MALIDAFTTAEKTSHNSHKFGFTLSPTNYGFWKTMIHPFLVTNNLIGYVDGSDVDHLYNLRGSFSTCLREYTLKTQLLKLEMKGDETSDAYLNRAKEYAYVVANIGEAFKEKDLVMFVVAGLCEDYNSLKFTLLARQLMCRCA
ncbi:hypothetical protein Tco_0562494 [Tanacetum coccineum]